MTKEWKTITRECQITSYRCSNCNCEMDYPRFQFGHNYVGGDEDTEEFCSKKCVLAWITKHIKDDA